MHPLIWPLFKFVCAPNLEHYIRVYPTLSLELHQQGPLEIIIALEFRSLALSGWRELMHALRVRYRVYGVLYRTGIAVQSFLAQSSNHLGSVASRVVTEQDVGRLLNLCLCSLNKALLCYATRRVRERRNKRYSVVASVNSCLEELHQLCVVRAQLPINYASERLLFEYHKDPDGVLICAHTGVMLDHQELSVSRIKPVL